MIRPARGARGGWYAGGSQVLLDEGVGEAR